MNILSKVRSILFENNSVKQTLFKNTFWIGFSSALGKILRAFLIIYIARILGPTDYGKFSFALAFVSVFVTFLDLGLSSIITRELSRDEKKEKDFSALFSLTLLLGLANIILITVGSFLITKDIEIQKIILILAAFSFLGQLPEIICAFLRARQKMEYEALFQIIQVLFIVGFGFFVIFNFPSVKNISYSYLFAALAALVPILIIFHFKFSPLKLSFKTDVWKSFLLMSWPLALTSIFGLVYGYIDSIMMGYWGQLIQTGWYNASFKIINVVLVPTSIISLSFFPILSKFGKEAKDKFQTVFNYQIGAMFFLALPTAVGGIILARPIIDFIYDPNYFPAVLAFQILLVMAGFAFLNVPFFQILIIVDQQKKIFWLTLLGAIINIILNMFLIPKFSLYGAASATVATYIIIFFLYVVFAYKFTPVRLFNKFVYPIFLKVILSTFIMYLAISNPKIYNLHAIFSVLTGIIVYFSSFAVISYFSGGLGALKQDIDF